MKKCGDGKSCGGTCIEKSRYCRVSMPTTLRGALDKASEEVRAKELVAVAKHIGGREAEKRAKDIRRQIAAERGGNVVPGEKGREFKRRLEAAGLIPKGSAGKPMTDVVEEEKKPIGNEPDKMSDLKVAWQAPRQMSRSPGGNVGPIRQELDEANRRQQHLDMLHSAMGHGGMTREDFKGDLSALLFAARDLRNQQGDGDERLNRAINGPGADASAAPMATRLARSSASSFDSAFPRIDQVRKIGDSVDWNESTGSGSKKLGQGAYGTVIQTKGGVAHKRGDVSSEEASIIKKLGEAGVGPKLIGAEINGPGNNRQTFVDVRTGRIAMEALDGAPLGTKSPGTHHSSGQKHADIYWRTRTQVHRAGVQHNDMHIDNVMVGKDGRGRIVDLGLAQDNPRAALAEALGAFSPPRGAVSLGDGDWQVKRWDVTGLSVLNNVMRGTKTYADLEQVSPVLHRINENKRDVISKMRNEMGLSDDEIGEIMTRGIRQKPEVYQKGAFAKLTDSQALDLINTLYEGV
jgi:hypothetical protein